MAFADDEEEDDNEDDESIEGLLDGATGCYLSNQLDDEDQLDDGKVRDPDAQHDPVASINLQQYLTDFQRSFSTVASGIRVFPNISRLSVIKGSFSSSK